MSSCQINSLNHLYKFIIHKINKLKICFFNRLYKYTCIPVSSRSRRACHSSSMRLSEAGLPIIKFFCFKESLLNKEFRELFTGSRLSVRAVLNESFLAAAFRMETGCLSFLLCVTFHLTFFDAQ